MPVVHYYLGRPASVYAATMPRRHPAGDDNGRVRRDIPGSGSPASGDAELIAFGVTHDDAPAARPGYPPRLAGAGGR
jgi:hypothetical protein